MDRLDVGRVLLAVPTNKKVDVIQKVWIGDVLYNIRLTEDGLAPSQETSRSRNLSGWKEEGTDSVGSDDSEWWPNNNLDGMKGSVEKVEDDDV
ncbi:unnamed protein product [Lupinus luteus]|uniref:Uncharacterized protein n=1 Tax=Lupinus luteus TaxID=3873 RepID=A0AAV1VXJ6_LUPLU